MIHKLIDWYLRYVEKRIIKKMGGIPLTWVIYNDKEEPPNVIVNLHPKIEQDEELEEKFRELADLVRERWE